MRKSRLMATLSMFVSLIIVVILTQPIACFHSSDSDGSGGKNNAQLVVYNLGKNISLNSGILQEISFSESFDVDQYGGPFSSITLDLQAHLSAVSISVPGVVNFPFPLLSVKSAYASVPGGQLYIRMARAEQAATVCDDGERYGPFDISLADTFQPESIEPPTVEATQQTLDIINAGGYAICLQIEPAITAIADLNSLQVDFGSCTEPPANIEGTWVGTYSCVGLGGLCDEGGPITIYITQNKNDPSIASYTDDSGASYQGRVCGNRFSYTGGVPGSYDESGTFEMYAENMASKNSSYLSVDTGGIICSGTCSDSLDR